MPPTEHDPGPSGDSEKKIDVVVGTTAGFFPAEGFDALPVNQKVDVQLKKAASKLKITDTTGWIATVTDASGKRTINVAQSYLDNGLAREATIDWGPSEGGGG